MHHIVHAATLPEAYHQALAVLHDYGEKRPCPAYNTEEKSISITIDIARPLMEPKISKLIPCGPAELQQYLMEMEDGIMDFEYTVGNWVYTYHARMIEQLICVVEMLKKDINSRRAVIMIREALDICKEDPPCLTIIQYIVNDGCLDCYVTFRSNDAVKAFFMNAYALIDIQRIIAEILNVKVGRYIHTANSFHAYARDWDRLDTSYKRIREEKDKLMIPEEGEWHEMMLEAIPDIKKKVETELKKHGMTHHGYFVGPLKNVIEREVEM